MQNIKVSDMGHSVVNLAVRAIDSKDAKTGLDNGQTQKQMIAFSRDILRGRELAKTDPTDRTITGINWLPGSVFIVEPRPSADMHDKAYSVLSGSHRLSWLESNVAILRELAKAERALATSSQGLAVTEHENAAIDADKKADAWNAFEVSCTIVHPADDDERRAIVAQGNADEPASDTKVKQADESKFPAFYNRMPRPEYLYQMDPVKKDTVRKVKGSEEGWSSTIYQANTGIGGNARVTYSALTRLGRHFDIPLSMFTPARLKIKPSVTPALLVKESAVGTGSDNVKHLGEGIEVRYIKARAESFGNAAKMEEVKQQFKEEFLELIDANGDGSKALGNEPERTKAEKEADKKAQDEANEQSEREALAALVTARSTYAFESQAVARVMKLDGAQPIAPCIGNALDLLNIVPESKYTPEAIAALTAFKNAPTDNAVIVAAVRALATMLESTLPQTATVTPIDAEPVSEAASAKHNTKKSKKS